MSIAAIVLAAGASHRLGEPKQLLKVQGETLLSRAVRLAIESGASPAIVVLGAHREAICGSVRFGNATVIVNENWELGMASSIQAGLQALDATPDQTEGVLLMTCDQPRLTTAHLRSLMTTFSSQPAPTIVASAYAGIRGVPAVFPPVAWQELRQLRGDQGARVLLRHPPCSVISLPLDGGEIDIDLPEDVAKLG